MANNLPGLIETGRYAHEITGQDAQVQRRPAARARGPTHGVTPLVGVRLVRVANNHSGVVDVARDAEGSIRRIGQEGQNSAAVDEGVRNTAHGLPADEVAGFVDGQSQRVGDNGINVVHRQGVGRQRGPSPTSKSCADDSQRDRWYGAAK